MLVSRIINGILTVLRIIAGVLIANVFSNGAMPYIRGLVKINVVLPVVLMMIYVGIVALVYFVRTANIRSTLRVPGITVLFASMGTLVTSIMALANNIVPATPGMTLLVGIGGFFFSLMILSFIFFIIRVVDRIVRSLRPIETPTPAETEV